MMSPTLGVAVPHRRSLHASALVLFGSLLTAACGGVVESSEDTSTSDAGCTSEAPCVVTLASGQDPEAIALDGTHVYWTNYTGAEGTLVKAVPITGGLTATLAESVAPNGSNGIAVDADRVYWTNAGVAFSTAPGGTVLSVSLAGGATSTLAFALEEPWDIAVGMGRVYWTNASSPSGCAVCSVAVDGGEVTTIASGQTGTGEPIAMGIAVDATGVYWALPGNANAPDGAIMFSPITGGTPRTLAAGLYSPTDIMLDGGWVYWTAFQIGPGNPYGNFNSGGVQSVAEGGGAVETVASGQSVPSGLAIDGTSAYWGGGYADALTNDLSAVPLQGGNAISLWSGPSTILGVVTDATSVYWAVASTYSTPGTSNHDGLIMKRTPKK